MDVVYRVFGGSLGAHGCTTSLHGMFSTESNTIDKQYQSEESDGHPLPEIMGLPGSGFG